MRVFYRNDDPAPYPWQKGLGDVVCASVAHGMLDQQAGVWVDIAVNADGVSRVCAAYETTEYAPFSTKDPIMNDFQLCNSLYVRYWNECVAFQRTMNRDGWIFDYAVSEWYDDCTAHLGKRLSELRFSGPGATDFSGSRS